MADLDTPVHRLLAAYASAVLAKDVDAFAALYADDVHVFDLWATWKREGIADWRAMAGQWFGSLGDERVQVDIADVRAHMAGDQAAGTATLTYRGLSADGRELRSLDNRITLVARREGDRWKIVHEHTSIPIDHATGKGIFKRP
jgi:uncharacterized protein (TIGR02246 family)